MINPSDYHRRLAQLRTLRDTGELDPSEYRRLAQGAELAYSLEAPQRKQARRRLRTAKDNGQVIVPQYCKACGGTSARTLEAHHDRPELPLAVRFLCSSRCHREAHRLKEIRI